MASAPQLVKGRGPRKSILDLAPLELECMNALWPLGEGTVRQIQQTLAESRPRAYTTIMTILDRLAHKGIVTRSKVGRAYLYRPNLAAEEARACAVERVVAGFFDGSAEALAAHLSAEPAGQGTAERRVSSATAAAVPRAKSVSIQPPAAQVEHTEKAPEVFRTTRLDESLL